MAPSLQSGRCAVRLTSCVTVLCLFFEGGSTLLAASPGPIVHALGRDDDTVWVVDGPTPAALFANALGVPFVEGPGSGDITFAPNGDLFASATENATIYRITPGGTVSVYHVGIEALALVVDPTGVLYALSRNDDTVYEINPTGTATVYATGIGLPLLEGPGSGGMAFSPSGELFASATENATIYRVPVGGGAGVVHHVGIEALQVAFDSVGSLFALDRDTDTVYEIVSPGTAVPYSTGLGVPMVEGPASGDMAFAGDDTLYVSAMENATIYQVPPGGGTPSVFHTGIQPLGLAVPPEQDCNGNGTPDLCDIGSGRSGSPSASSVLQACSVAETPTWTGRSTSPT